MAILSCIKDHPVCRVGKADDLHLRHIPPISHYLRGRTVLLADSTTERYHLGEMLVATGAVPTLVTTGTAVPLALEAAAQEGRPFAAAVIDVRLSGVDGRALGRQIHGHPGLTGCTVLLLSPGDMPPELPVCREAGIAAYLRRPIRLTSLSDALIMALAQ